MGPRCPWCSASRATPSSGAGEQQWLVLAAGQIEAFTGRSLDLDLGAGRPVVGQPAAHAAVGQHADVQFEYAFGRQAGDGVAARETVRPEDGHELSGAKLE